MSIVFNVKVRGAMEIAVFIQNIQEERAEVALYIFSTQINVNVSGNSTMNKVGNSMGLAERFQQTDRALEEVPTWPDVTNILLVDSNQEIIVVLSVTVFFLAL